MHGRYSLFLFAGAILLGACASDLEPIPDDMDAIHESCVEVEPDTWECESGVEAQTQPGSVTGTLAPGQAGVEEPQVYGRVYDPPGCYYCGQHSGQGLYDWAPCPWGESIWRFHCVECNYYSGYDRILYDCGTPVIAKDPINVVNAIPADGRLEVSVQE